MTLTDATQGAERRARVQGDWERARCVNPPGTIAWSEHVAVWEVYAARYGRDQSAERMEERGGFGYDEIAFLTGKPPQTWRPL